MKYWFQAGGAVPSSSPLYIERQSDRLIQQEILRGEYVHIFAPRQIGKTSLLRKTESELRQQGWKTSYIDLSLWMDCSKAEWYALLGETLSMDFLHEHSAKLTNQIDFRQFIIKTSERKKNEKIALFFDEVEGIRKVRGEKETSFADTFLMTLRNLYIQRQDYNGSIVCIFAGSTDPNHLIKDPDISPFNIGAEIDIDHFTKTETYQLISHLESLPIKNLDNNIPERIFYWTQGHPYLVQKICLEIEKLVNNGKLSKLDISKLDTLVREIFLFPLNPVMGDKNVRHVEKMLRGLKNTSRGVWNKLVAGTQIAIADIDHDTYLELYLTGAVHCEKNQLAIRNSLYEQAFANLVLEIQKPQVSVPDAKYVVNINQGKSVQIGDEGHFDQNVME